MDKNDYINIQKGIDTILDNWPGIEYIHGMLTAILCAPEIIPPSVWLTALLEKDGKEPVFKSKEDVERLMDLLMSVYKEISKSLADDAFYPLLSHRKDPGEDQLRAEPETAQTWCKGFVGGLSLWETDIAQDEKVRELLTPIFILTDRSIITEDIPEISTKSVTQLEKYSVSAIAESVAHLREYYLLKTKFTNKRIGRNEPCPCGSGKKYKKCCGNI